MQPLIELNNVSLQIHEKKIINDFSITIFPGDFVVILGGNGSGKSTLLKLINQTYRQTQGNILFDNKPLNALLDKNKIITITQFIADNIFVDLTVEENATLLNDKKIASTDLSKYLAQFNEKLAGALHTIVKNLSGGEQQILAFALYLRHHPAVLLLDEHTSALDPKKSDSVMALTHQFIRQKNITCLMTTHQLNYALQYGNRLLAIREGELAFQADAQDKSNLTVADLLQYCY